MADAKPNHTLTLDQQSTSAFFHVLSVSTVKGRADRRIHARCMAAVKQNCMNMQDAMNGDFRGGTVTLDEDAVMYMYDSLGEQMEKGIPGQLAEGYDSLDNQLQKLKDIIDPPKADEKKK
jgi:hypothetical protein